MRRELLPSEPTTADELRIFAQTLDIQGNLELESGRSADAADSWKQAAQIYAKLKNESGRSQSLINRAEALEVLGLYPTACDTLLQAFGFDQPDCKPFIQDKQFSPKQQENQLSPEQ